MAGFPLKRARKQGVRLADGSIIAFPYMPRVADLPPGWRHFTTAQKIEHLIGLDRCDKILSWGPFTDVDQLRLSRQVRGSTPRRSSTDCSPATVSGSASSQT
jgi:hypothetical protein